VNVTTPINHSFDAVKKTQSLEVESVSLPEMSHAFSKFWVQDIPLPDAQPSSILQKTSACGSPT
jgi:WW domain-binding protein 11